ncbi:hypothetical protein FNU76_19995 [Chitinimonas arctica]|uniref:Uncharacterized protein n=1 Tax=Chitinimonas arctica TaxID=2594795 RepID=A0A516SJX3_9NEIS|nr:hypothetical protein [Chitinimonas arctica]QDQ28455.1 hypothetical protein FNU76_19995 [Chitinimonas arctica]
MSEFIVPSRYRTGLAVPHGQSGGLIDAVKSRDQERIALNVSHIYQPEFFGGGGISTAGGLSTKGIVNTTTSLPRRVIEQCRRPTAAVQTPQERVGRDDFWWIGITKAAFQQAQTPARHVPTAAARLRVERLASIQAVFCLSTQEMANVLRVSRQGYYKWLDAANVVKLQEANRERLTTVERIAAHWRQLSNIPLSGVAYEPLSGGRTLLSLITGELLDEVSIRQALEELFAKLGDRPKTRSQEMAEAGFTRRNRSLPSDD